MLHYQIQLSALSHFNEGDEHVQEMIELLQQIVLLYEMYLLVKLF